MFEQLIHVVPSFDEAAGFGLPPALMKQIGRSRSRKEQAMENLEETEENAGAKKRPIVTNGMLKVKKMVPGSPGAAAQLEEGDLLLRMGRPSRGRSLEGKAKGKQARDRAKGKASAKAARGKAIARDRANAKAATGKAKTTKTKAAAAKAAAASKSSWASLPFVADFVDLEEMLDSAVGETLQVVYFRPGSGTASSEDGEEDSSSEEEEQDGGDDVDEGVDEGGAVGSTTVVVKDLHSLIPRSFLEVGDSLFHDVPYQFAKEHQRGQEGVGASARAGRGRTRPSNHESKNPPQNPKHPIPSNTRSYNIHPNIPGREGNGAHSIRSHPVPSPFSSGV